MPAHLVAVDPAGFRRDRIFRCKTGECISPRCATREAVMPNGTVVAVAESAPAELAMSLTTAVVRAWREHDREVTE
jgi:hypothetical protein